MKSIFVLVLFNNVGEKQPASENRTYVRRLKVSSTNHWHKAYQNFLSILLTTLMKQVQICNTQILTLMTESIISYCGLNQMHNNINRGREVRYIYKLRMRITLQKKHFMKH